MHRLTLGFFISLIALILVGCGSPKLTPLEQDAVIVAFGDSLTAGVGTQEQYSYPSVLARLTGHKVINAGISGEQTEEGLARLPQVLRDHSPSLLILLEGGNDILRNKDYLEIESNLDLMIEMAKAKGVQVVLIGVPEKSLFSNSAPFYASLAERHDLVFDSTVIGSLMRSPSMKSDPIHFNKAGYQAMAQSIYDLLSSHGAFD